jgi:hypothetical protein
MIILFALLFWIGLAVELSGWYFALLGVLIVWWIINQILS